MRTTISSQCNTRLMYNVCGTTNLLSEVTLGLCMSSQILLFSSFFNIGSHVYLYMTYCNDNDLFTFMYMYMYSYIQYNLYIYTCIFVCTFRSFLTLWTVLKVYLSFQGLFELGVQSVWYLLDSVWQRYHVAWYAYNMFHCPHTRHLHACFPRYLESRLP